ncbi:MAG: hypothetical protein R3B91_01175 [Planctomycetaceae bacterium]
MQNAIIENLMAPPPVKRAEFRDALSPLSQLIELVAAEFGPLKLKQVLERMIAEAELSGVL